MPITLLSVLPLCLWPVAGIADIYRCSTAAGIVEFTDRPCVGGELTAPSGGTGLVLPALSIDEQARIEELADRTRKRAQIEQREASQSAARRARAERDHRVACAQAMVALERLRTTRRKGYRLADDDKLKDEERKYSAMQSTHCGRRARRVMCAAIRRWQGSRLPRAGSQAACDA